MTDLHSLAAACHEDNREKASQLFTDFAMFPRLDTSSRLAPIGWGLLRQITNR